MSGLSSQPTFDVKIPACELSEGEREYRAFLHLLPALLPAYRGRYVAIHDGQVVDADADDIALVQRVHARVGYVPIHVGLVTDHPLTQSKVVNGRIEEAVKERELANARRFLIRLLNQRFPGQVALEVVEAITSQPSLSMLENWFDQASQVASFADFVLVLRA